MPDYHPKYFQLEKEWPSGIEGGPSPVQTHRYAGDKREFFTTVSARAKAWVPCAPKYHHEIDWGKEKKWKHSKWLKDKRVTTTDKIYNDAKYTIDITRNPDEALNRVAKTSPGPAAYDNDQHKLKQMPHTHGTIKLNEKRLNFIHQNEKVAKEYKGNWPGRHNDVDPVSSNSYVLLVNILIESIP